MRKTETRILTSLANGTPLSPGQIDSLMVKIGKGQKKSRARRITDSAEIRYAAQIALMNQAQQQITQRAITDYSCSSQAINLSCRNGQPSAAAFGIDAMFAAFTAIGYANERRITYRLMTFPPGTHVPYGSAMAPTIAAGDRITDAGFVSASENRQLLVNGVTNPAAGTCYVKMVIIGRGGVNISGGSQYNNANEQLLLRQLYPKSWRVRTAHSGQAEILYPRNTVFLVNGIGQSNNNVHVSLSISLAGGAVKNSFTGV